MADEMVKQDKTLSPFEMGKQLYKLEQMKKEIEDRLPILRAGLLETMKELKVLTLKTEEYTISKVSYNRLVVTDDEAAKLSLEKNNVKVAWKLDMPQMKTSIRALLKEGIEFDGITPTATEFVSVRLTKKESDKKPSA